MARWWLGHIAEALAQEWRWAMKNSCGGGLFNVRGPSCFLPCFCKSHTYRFLAQLCAKKSIGCLAGALLIPVPTFSSIIPCLRYTFSSSWPSSRDGLGGGWEAGLGEVGFLMPSASTDKQQKYILNFLCTCFQETFIHTELSQCSTSKY